MYLNVDAGTMNPVEHGEVFVTDDGLETDQDLGNYERFLNVTLHRHNYMTMGQVYWDILNRERSLGYKGKTVQGHIHVPEEIISKIENVAKEDKAEIVLIEVGGTVGEYQNMLFFEAIRRMKQEKPKNTFLIHLVYLPVPPSLGEMKSKPAQSSIYELYRLGLSPDMVICRSENPVDDKRRSTLSFNTGVKIEHIFSAPNADTVYKVPLMFEEQQLENKLLKIMGLKRRTTDLKKWKDMVKRSQSAKHKIKIAILGKYFTSGNFSLEDAYISVLEAIKHASWQQNAKPEIKWFDVERFENLKECKVIENELKDYDGVIVPQGWGSRGVEGKITALRFIREKKIPFLGLCFGMQMAVIEYARNVLKFPNANTEEANKNTSDPVIHIMPAQQEYLRNKQYGGTIRLGSWPCVLKKSSIAGDLYSSFGDGLQINERHRHRYEFNNKYKKLMEDAGLVISGTSPDGLLVEAIELQRSVHPFFVGTQFHPEYKSRPLKPHPLFIGFIKAAKDRAGKKV
jgi:CTP synthase